MYNSSLKYSDLNMLILQRRFSRKHGGRQVSLNRRRGSCLKSYPLTGDKRCDCRSTLIRPFKLLRSREMIDARIPARIYTENPVIIRVLRCFRREIIRTPYLSLAFSSPPLPLLTLRVLFFFFLFSLRLRLLLAL